MEPPVYVIRAIDGTPFELMPDGSLIIHQHHGQSITLPAEVVYALYLFLMTPGTRPALRRLDDERQRRLYETRYSS